MQLRRVIKTLRAKWVVVVILAIAGGAIGSILATNHNDAIRPRWRAQAPVTFFQLDEEEGTSNNGRAGTTESSGTVDVESERARAGLLLEEILEANPRLTIQTDRENNALLFIAVGRSGEDALSEALALRDEYQALGATVLSSDQIDATMAQILGDIDNLKEQIAALEVAEPEAEDPAVTAQREALQTEISKLDQRQAQISIWILNPELRPTEAEFFGVEPDATRAADETDEEEEEPPPIVTLEALQEEQTRNNIVLARLRGELDRLPDPPAAEGLTNAEQLELEALQLDLDELELEYVDLFRRRDGRPPGGFVEEPVLTDETQAQRSVGISLLLGALVGMLLAGVGIVGYDQIRQPVWAAEDLDGVTSLGFVNRQREDGDEEIWYPTSLSQRRRDIQRLRAATDGVTGERPAIIGFFGLDVAGEEVGELAADLAVSYTIADREVLLIDGNSFQPNILPEFGSVENILNELLMTPMAPAEATDRINQFLDAAERVSPGLTAVHVDAESHDPIDVFASPNCRVLTDVAASRYDVVLIAGPEVSDPLADAVIHRVDIVTLVGYVGYTEKSRIETVAEALLDRKAEVAGVVLLDGRRQPVRDQITEYFRSVRGEVEETDSADLGSNEAVVDGETSAMEEPEHATARTKGESVEAATVPDDPTEPEIEESDSAADAEPGTPEPGDAGAEATSPGSDAETTPRDAAGDAAKPVEPQAEEAGTEEPSVLDQAKAKPAKRQRAKR